MPVLDKLIRSPLIPDFLLRVGIRQVIANRHRELMAGTEAEQEERYRAWVAELRQSPIAIDPSAANTQHYEVPPPFFEHVLGPHLKYSCGYWPDPRTSLAESEEAMLDLYVERAELEDGQVVLDLGCGWGSFSLWAAERFPGSKIFAVSNSAVQREWIRARAAARALSNVKVITADAASFTPDNTFDRIVSIEMFEHLRNYEEMFRRVSEWLEPEGRFFLHIFSHVRCGYPYVDEGPSDWMARHFFTGGMMPADRLVGEFDRDLHIDAHWRLPGTHYARTSLAWLQRMDARKPEIMEIFRETYGPEAQRFWAYWRIFFLAVAEMFAFGEGSEWIVSHYRLTRTRKSGDLRPASPLA